MSKQIEEGSVVIPALIQRLRARTATFSGVAGLAFPLLNEGLETGWRPSRAIPSGAHRGRPAGVVVRKAAAHCRSTRADLGYSAVSDDKPALPGTLSFQSAIGLPKNRILPPSSRRDSPDCRRFDAAGVKSAVPQRFEGIIHITTKLGGVGPLIQEHD